VIIGKSKLAPQCLGGDGGVTKTHGWVLPVTRKHDLEFVGTVWFIHWFSSERTPIWKPMCVNDTNGIGSWRSALPESANVAVNTLQGIHGCLLLRLGRIDLAMLCRNLLISGASVRG